MGVNGTRDFEAKKKSIHHKSKHWNTEDRDKQNTSHELEV